MVVVTLTTPGSNVWTCPAFVTSITVECWGAGGGSGASTSGEGGGGGGGYSKRTGVAVTPGNSYGTVGQGGAPTVAGGDTSLVGNSLTTLAKGGSPGNGRTAGAGGASASGQGTTKFSGGNGGAGVAGSPAGGGGGGSSGGTAANGNNGTAGSGGVGGAGGIAPTGGAAGGAGGGSGIAGSSAPSFGGGGGGGGDTANGGTGGNGKIVITYSFDPLTVTPTAAQCAAKSTDPAVVLGSLTLSPALAKCAAKSVDPVAVLGSLSITPIAGVCKSLSSGPSVILGSLTILPAAAIAASLTAVPTAVFTSITFTPAPAVAASRTSGPAVALSELLGSPFVRPAKKYVTLVEFKYGDPADPDFYRLTDWTDDVTHEGVIWRSMPELDVTVPPNLATLQEEPLKVESPPDPFFVELSQPWAQPPVFTRVLQIAIPAGGQDVDPDEITLFNGLGESIESNARGKADRYSFEAITWKARASIPLGTPATPHCTNEYGKPGCFFDVEAEKREGIVVEIDGQQVTITGLPSHGNAWWHRGRVRYRGVEISIRKWKPALPEVFHLVDAMPPSWAGATILVLPGCDRKKTTCRDIMNNEKNFNGIGIAIPAYNPNFENPDE